MSETKFHELPILDVHKENIGEAWPIIINAIEGATFVGLDAELSGLGELSKSVTFRSVAQALFGQRFLVFFSSYILE